MGLDMYLYKKHYIGNKFRKRDQIVRVVVPENQKDATFPTGKIQNKRISEITEEVMYWRKANVIHSWFVNNVQDGEDDCGDYCVSRERLKELLDICNEIIKASKLVKGKIRNGKKLTKNGWKDIMEKGMYIEDPKVAIELLPTTSGFFFGGTDYDQYYFEDIKDTKEMLTKILKEKDGDFYYHSSW